MSICIALSVPDGIALAADSQTTWHNTIVKVKDRLGNDVDLAQPINIPVGWSKMSKKLFQLKFSNKNYAAMWAGAASINQKTLYSILKSLEKKYEGDGSYENVSEYIVTGIRKEFVEEFGMDDISQAPIKVVELILAGFQDDDVSKPIIEQQLIFSGVIQTGTGANTSGYFLGWTNSGNNKFGCCWIGEKIFINHIVNHQNQDLPPIQGQYNMMSLEDAKDYARFLVEYTCDFQRFAIMVPTCGRPIVLAKLTPDNYEEEIV